MFTHTVISREVLEQDGCNLKLSAGALKPPRPANLCSAALLSARPWCVFFTLLLSPDFLGLLSHDCAPAPSDRGCQLAVRHSGGSSWINSLCTENGSLRQTHMHSISVAFVHIQKRKAIKKKYGKKNRQGDIYYLLRTSWKHNLRRTVCLWMTSEADERSWQRILLFLAVIILSRRAHTSLWRTAGVKNISSFSCSLFPPSFLSLPFHSLQFTTREVCQAKCWPWFPGVSRESWLCRPWAELRSTVKSQQVAYLREFADAL